MNQRPTGLSLSKATVGFLQYKSAEGLSPVTVSGYDHDLKLWIEYQGDMDVAHSPPETSGKSPGFVKA